MADVENAGPNIPRAPKAFTQKLRWSSQLKGALVEVTFKDLDKVKGYVRWVGTPDFAAGKKFVGVELNEPLGRNNGTIESRQYFACAENHGIFVRPFCLTLLKKPRRQTIVERTNLATEKKKQTMAKRHAERMRRIHKIDYAKRVQMRSKGITIRESLGVRHLCTPTRTNKYRNIHKNVTRPRSDRRTKRKILFASNQDVENDVSSTNTANDKDRVSLDLAELPPLPNIPFNVSSESDEASNEVVAPDAAHTEQTEQITEEEVPGTTWLQVIEATQYLQYDKQAKWLLNGYWTDVFGPDEVLREKLWKIAHMMVEVDAMGTSGTGLGKADALALFARVKSERLHALHSTEDTLRAVDLNGDGKISLIKFFKYVFEVRAPPAKFRPCNEEKDKRNQRIAEKQLAAANQALAESKVASENAKAMERKAQEAANEVIATAQAKMDALKAAEEAEQALSDSLLALDTQEEAKTVLVQQLTQLSQAESTGLVAKNKALFKLQALQNEDPAPLCKAKLTLTYSMKKAKRARKMAHTKAKKAKEAEMEMQRFKDEAADAAANCQASLTKALEGFSLADDMMSGARAPLCCNGNGSDWWAVRLAQAAHGEDEEEELDLDDNHVAEVEVKRRIRRHSRRSSFDAEAKREALAARSQEDIISHMEQRALELAKQQLGEAEQKAQEFERKYAREMEIRKRLHNNLVDMQGKIRVFCRIRPILELEMNKVGATDICSYTSNDRIHVAREKGDPTNFKFNAVFQPKSTQTEVFAELRPFITSALDGYNVCIFAYGQTGSGKTYTMQGCESDPGVYVRTLNELFEVQERTKGTKNYSFQVSILEIYNETLRDLLVGGKNNKASLKITSDEEGNTDIQGLTREKVLNEAEVQQLLARGSRIRQTAGHDANATSSRSHLVFTIYCQAMDVAKGTMTTAKLNLIDLAGSERLSKTNAKKHMLTEAKNINKSLSALGNVICSLGKSKHVPYRNSKLTFALRDCLGGKSKVLMFVNCSPVQSNMSETLCSLRFASRCSKTALGKAEKNIDNKANAMLKRENQRLRNRIAELEEQLRKALQNSR